jgi:hypothetical protein
MSTYYSTAEELRHALHVLAEHAEAIAQDTNAAITLLTYAERFGMALAAPAAAPADQAEAVYARRRAAVAAAAAQRRP